MVQTVTASYRARFLPRTCILKALLLRFLESGPADTFKPHPLFGLVCFAVVLVAIIVEAL